MLEAKVLGVSTVIIVENKFGDGRCIDQASFSKNESYNFKVLFHKTCLLTANNDVSESLEIGGPLLQKILKELPDRESTIRPLLMPILHKFKMLAQQETYIVGQIE